MRSAGACHACAVSFCAGRESACSHHFHPAPPMRVLIAEDEKKVSNFIRKALREASYAVDEVHDGEAAFEMALGTAYDAIILDIMLPGRDGLSVLKLLRAQRIDTPVLILTARGEVSE